MDAQYKVDVLLIRIYRNVALEVDPSISFIDLYDIMNDYLQNPLINPIAYIVDLNKTITNQYLIFRDLSLQDGSHIKIYIYDSKVLPQELQNPPQIANRINLILKVLNDQPILIKHIGPKHTLNDAIEFLFSCCGYKFIALTNYRVWFIVIEKNSSSHYDYFDQSTSFNKLHKQAKKQINCPIDSAVFEICNVCEIVNYQKKLQFQEIYPNDQYQAQIFVKFYSQAVYDLIQDKKYQQQQNKIIEQQMKAEEQQKIKELIELSELQDIQQPLIQEEFPYQDDRINLIFEIIDGDVKYVQIIKIKLNKTLKEIKEILILQHHLTSIKYFDIVFHKTNCDTFFNPKELKTQLYQLKLRDNDKIRYRIRYTDGL